ncbi:MAG TPA: TIGR02147 family protein [Bdellovibrionota bacterium]|jgi:uncharacterized protein (TIGR02147 family)|nr:TIGR02147 family protein [Bdellovibrionota bacterium]
MLSPGLFLKEIIRLKILKNPSLSIRSIARATGVSGAYLSRVMSGKSTISIQRADAIADKLKFSRIERAAFLQSVAVYSARGEARVTLLKALDEVANAATPFTLQEYALLDENAQSGLLARWYLPALLDLVTCTNFEPNVEWIAKRLSLSSEEVSWGLAHLERIGLLDRSSPKWRKNADAIYCATEESRQAVRHFHTQMSQKAVEQLNTATDKSAYERRSVTGLTLAVDSAKLPVAKRLIERFQHRLANHLTLGNCTEVYHLNVQLFPLTRGAE